MYGPASACCTSPHLNAPEISVLLWTRLSGDSPAVLCTCESQRPHKVRNPIVPYILMRSCLKMNVVNEGFRELGKREAGALEDTDTGRLIHLYLWTVGCLLITTTDCFHSAILSHCLIWAVLCRSSNHYEANVIKTSCRLNTCRKEREDSLWVIVQGVFHRQQLNTNQKNGHREMIGMNWLYDINYDITG